MRPLRQALSSVLMSLQQLFKIPATPGTKAECVVVLTDADLLSESLQWHLQQKAMDQNTSKN